jgi:hypothetical protein
MENFMIKSSCHCGAVELEIDGEIPATLTSCNCSFCRRSGALMAYYSPKQVKVLAKPGSTSEYIWGDKCLAQVRCNTCGCLSHWRSLDPKQTDKMGINARLFTNVEFHKIRIRNFDGADTWKFLD